MNTSVSIVSAATSASRALSRVFSNTDIKEVNKSVDDEDENADADVDVDEKLHPSVTKDLDPFWKKNTNSDREGVLGQHGTSHSFFGVFSPPILSR